VTAQKSAASEPNRRFFVIPIAEDADLRDLIEQHPNAWLLDSTTGVMTSLAGWSTKATAPNAA
jgi:hypothetical protein